MNWPIHVVPNQFAAMFRWMYICTATETATTVASDATVMTQQPVVTISGRAQYLIADLDLLYAVSETRLILESDKSRLRHKLSVLRHEEPFFEFVSLLLEICLETCTPTASRSGIFLLDNHGGYT